MSSSERINLRPHHGLCMAFFQGKGYSDGFSRHMAEVVELLEGGGISVTLTAGWDEICSRCPNRVKGACPEAERYDRRVLSLCGLREGETLPAEVLRGRVEERILRPGLREEVCGNCPWSGICTPEHRRQKST